MKLTFAYYPWITQGQGKTQETIRAAVVGFASLCGTELGGAATEVLPPVDVPLLVNQVATGECQIALLNPLGYALAKKDGAPITAPLVALRKIDDKLGDFYITQLYSQKKTAIARLLQTSLAAKDLTSVLSLVKNYSIGFGKAVSTSNFLVPAHELWGMGAHPLVAFRRVEFLGVHE